MAPDSVQERRDYIGGYNSTSECVMSSKDPDQRKVRMNCSSMNKDAALASFAGTCNVPLVSPSNYGFTKATVNYDGGDLKCDFDSCDCEVIEDDGG